jgi:hypothetical protein
MFNWIPSFSPSASDPDSEGRLAAEEEACDWIDAEVEVADSLIDEESDEVELTGSTAWILPIVFFLQVLFFGPSRLAGFETEGEGSTQSSSTDHHINPPNPWSITDFVF